MSRSKSGLKRSTVILDDNMVREYKLALEKLTLDNTKQAHAHTQAPKQINTSDSASSISSMLSRDNSIMDLLLIDEDESEFLDGEETSEVVFLSKGQSQLDFQLDLWENDTAVLSRTPLEF
ncbi:chaperone protein htpG [Kluyveromyces marxianus]|uniref:Chaperone protein htpG n=2 Tax=Kluyveromyces marxianus TaxID=4911 RepID=W0TBF4_KLUMD|nr:chaperone protein htpG [Kluyveromyces marxianus DMKU3-1042]QGN15885.1 chaperone protein htpG [Kluyveromyces marxianus]BAO40151.1 chaperone protein htpG [Kluyveromyces marxianus DMKU3-1042]BAP71644.1 chaperone protein htpG [Kluyveromyces marxianus]